MQKRKRESSDVDREETLLGRDADHPNFLSHPLPFCRLYLRHLLSPDLLRRSTASTVRLSCDGTRRAGQPIPIMPW